MKDKKIKNMVLLSSAESSCARRRVEEVVEVDRVAGVLDERALRTDSCRLAVSAWQSCVTAGTVQQAGQLDKMVQEWEKNRAETDHVLPPGRFEREKPCCGS
jgi:hypothetical protein